jgi:hypothetical protein
MPPSPDEEMRTYEFVQSGQKRRITVPASWRMTYGQIAPGVTRGGYGLRFYENTSKDTTRAVFADVTEIRDVTIRLERMAYRKFGTNDWVQVKPYSRVDESDKWAEAWVSEDEIHEGYGEIEGKSEDEAFVATFNAVPRSTIRSTR